MKVKIVALVVFSVVSVSTALAQNNQGNNQGVQGGGTPNYIAKFTGKNSVGNSGLLENSSGLVTDESLKVGNFTAIVSTPRSIAVHGLNTTPDGDTADGLNHAIGLFGETSSPTSAAVVGIGNSTSGDPWGFRFDREPGPRDWRSGAGRGRQWFWHWRTRSSAESTGKCWGFQPYV